MSITRTPSPGRRVVRPAAAALVVALALGLGGCGGDDGSSRSPQADPTSSSPSPSEDQGDGSGANAGTVAISVADGTVDPIGERVDVAVGEELVLEITADVPGELHVHSTPEQEIAFGQGTTTASIPVQQPGVIEVEEHESGAVVLQIEAR